MNAVEVEFSDKEIIGLINIVIKHEDHITRLSEIVGKFKEFRDNLPWNIVYSLRSRLQVHNKKYSIQYNLIMGKVGREEQIIDINEANDYMEHLGSIFEENNVHMKRRDIEISNEIVKSLLYSATRRVLENRGFRSLGLYIYYSPSEELSLSKIFKLYRGFEIRYAHIHDKWFVLIKPKLVIDSCTMEELSHYVESKMLEGIYCKAPRLCPLGEIYKQAVLRRIDMKARSAIVEFYDGSLLEVPLSRIKLLGKFEYYKHILAQIGESYEELQQKRREVTLDIGYKEFDELRRQGRYKGRTLAEEYYRITQKLATVWIEVMNNIYLDNVRIRFRSTFKEIGGGSL
ncbi:MAG: hypothetical protein DRN15_06320 [Thermoprotei archaeon]|nr:MAG: hypothetical protein DRN15_06320 [Thermoprotei archaeon]